MKRIDISYKIFSFNLIFALAALTGCSNEHDNLTVQSTEETQQAETQAPEKITQAEEPSPEEIPQITEIVTDENQEEIAEPAIIDVDWSDYK